MGCNESKQDVATGNTISRKKPEDVNSKRGGKDSDPETFKDAVPEENSKTSISMSTVQQQERREQKGQDVISKGDNNNTEGVAEGVKDVADDHDKENVVEEQEQEQEGGRSISKESPHRFFSSRKDEDAAEVRSEKSEYDSPRHIESGKESLLLDQGVKLEDAAAGEKALLVGETKQEAENGEPTAVKGENLVKQGEAAATIQPNAQNAALEKKKKTADDEDKLEVSPTN